MARQVTIPAATLSAAVLPGGTRREAKLEARLGDRDINGNINGNMTGAMGDHAPGGGGGGGMIVNNWASSCRSPSCFQPS